MFWYFASEMCERAFNSPLQTFGLSVRLTFSHIFALKQLMGPSCVLEKRSLILNSGILYTIALFFQCTNALIVR